MTPTEELPQAFAQTREALHQVAYFAMAPARHQAAGRMGLQPAPGGFGTPEFEGKVARVEGDLLVLEHRDGAASQLITTVRDAARFLGVDYRVDWFPDFHDPLEPIDPDRRLAVDRDAAVVLGEWFRFGFEVLGELRLHVRRRDDVSEPQLWPEHFDAAIEIGIADDGRGAAYGASPGDESSEYPYLYVSAWSEIDRSIAYWNEESFNGASLSYRELFVTGDPRERGLDFLLEGYRALHAG